MRKHCNHYEFLSLNWTRKTFEEETFPSALEVGDSKERTTMEKVLLLAVFASRGEEETEARFEEDYRDFSLRSCEEVKIDC